MEKEDEIRIVVTRLIRSLSLEEFKWLSERFAELATETWRKDISDLLICVCRKDEDFSDEAMRKLVEWINFAGETMKKKFLDDFIKDEKFLRDLQKHFHPYQQIADKNI